MAKPWFRLWASDYLMDDRLFGCPPEAEGLLIRTWCLCWQHGSAPAEPVALARAARLDPRYVKRHLSHVLPFFVVKEGALFSVRMERERAESGASDEQKRVLAQAAANTRWQRERRAKRGNVDASRNADAMPPAECVRHASQSQSQSQRKTRATTDLLSEVCAEPLEAAASAPPASPVVARIPLAGKRPPHEVTEADVAALSESFPGLDVPAEIRRIAAWNVANPDRRKTERGIRAHITRWLDTEQNRARPTTDRRGGPKPLPGLGEGDLAHYADR